MDLIAEWDETCGWIELAFEMIRCDSTANPLHLHLGFLLERCTSYSLRAVGCYGKELAALTFHFSFVFYPAPGDLDEFWFSVGKTTE